METFDEMIEIFRAIDQTIVTVDDFDTDRPATDVNVIIVKDQTSMIVRIGWGSYGLHADVYGYRGGKPVATEPVQIDLPSSVYVND
jgi:hypothetical protein